MMVKCGAGGGIRTPEGMKPFDLQSNAFGRFATPAYLRGADRGIRTHDPLFTKQPLWPLSYVGKMLWYRGNST